jgi:glycine/serine hydroxymethyltransferase
MRENEIKKIVAWIDEAIKNKDSEEALSRIKDEVKQMCFNFPIPSI